jgi:hypothetical protein
VNTGETFRLGSPTLGIRTVGTHREAIMIPAGAFVRITGLCSEGDRLVDCSWNGQLVALFAVDIRERGMSVREARR